MFGSSSVSRLLCRYLLCTCLYSLLCRCLLCRCLLCLPLTCCFLLPACGQGRTCLFQGQPFGVRDWCSLLCWCLLCGLWGRQRQCGLRSPVPRQGFLNVVDACVNAVPCGLKAGQFSGQCDQCKFHAAYSTAKIHPVQFTVAKQLSLVLVSRQEPTCHVQRKQKQNPRLKR